ncbi:DNA helicase PcrA [Synechococcus sp. R55.3]|uniref:DNA helicase PcrA n=1 Tax=unclassified Synechococcus TaxID=2626047 RepID=UPI0039C3D3F0
MTHASLLDALNPSQRQAVQHFCGPLLVVAGAGSGKTRALTHRIAYLVRHYRVDPGEILAVTFTNKAAREMKERIEQLFAEQEAQEQFGIPLEELEPAQATRLKSAVYHRWIKPLWIGTFHSLFAQILRIDIEKYQDPKGRKWTRNFSIFDESDAQSLVKEIVTKQLNLDERKFDPRSVRYAISNAKNQGWTPADLERNQPNFRGRTIAQVYEIYEDQLAANNALDFDNLIWIPVQLFRQNEQVLAYWHQRFRHILVDEYQDTNRTQYELIRLLATNGETCRSRLDWRNRSIFVVGDADQSIYRFRGADFTILLEFQETFGDGLPDDDTRTMIKLEENYRSTATILQAANALIEKNTERIDKVLRPTRQQGSPIFLHQADDEIAEAEFVVNTIRRLHGQNANAFSWGDFAILYRTNAQSRPFEEVLLRWGIPYTVVGGLRFYDRKEIKDVLAYLRVVANPADSFSLLRIINVPRRGIGKSTLDKLTEAAAALNVPLWAILSDETSVSSLAGRSAKPVIQFAQLIQHWHRQASQTSAATLIEGLLRDSGYLEDLKAQGTDEAEERAANVMELYNAARQFEEEQEDPSLEAFLSNVSLASDLDNLQEGAEKVSLMTLHSSKGLEFPVVFLVGVEQGLFPNFRALEDPAALEEERRLCYVGITRAREQLYISHARERMLYGNREPAIPSVFLSELPQELIESDRRGAPSRQLSHGSGLPLATAHKAKPNPGQGRSEQWAIGDRLQHPQFGQGQITHVFGSGERVTIAVRFPGIGQQKILDPRIAPIQKLS